MPNYRRVWQPGGCYFFTVTLRQRCKNRLLVEHINELRKAVRRVRASHPFSIHGWVVLPDHMHCLIELPPNDCDFAIRWRLIKSYFSREIPRSSREPCHERGIWQRRFWEHLVRDERDYRAHLDYVHINPVKHGLVTRVADWPYSTFHRYVAQGVYAKDWANDDLANLLPYRD
ncbi:transposase [Marinobacterium nitratireducens]|uniref:Transposase n=1 Tax=Marinobacterium nitratireducens TaxID=518897 RepID=A0A917ZLY8_9GAMM|nr:transposase [Marinobacterium nitratireducens]GGO85058.1 transposase [Marinobacterium nitratireducens]